nr:CYP87A3 [Digitalis lanata]
MSLVAMSVGAILIIITIITNLVFKWWNRSLSSGGVLPPGSFGWPLIGETLHFFTPNTSFDVTPFVKDRMKRYGPIFKTSLVGVPVIVSTDADLNNFIFQQEGQTFQSWYPSTFTEIFGRENLSTLHGFMYKYFKNMVLGLFGPESLKTMISEVETTSNINLKRWSENGTIELKDAIAEMIFELTAKKLISYELEKSPYNLRDNFVAFIDGLISFPLNIPGTAYYKCLQGRNNAIKMLKAMLHERREKPRETQTDFFDYVLEEFQKEDTIITETLALDLMFVLLFASHETASIALTLAMKFLVDHPLVLEKLTEEHDEIIKTREDPNSGLTWNEYKSMKFTFQFINETLRLANIAPLIFRKALTETEFKGFTIPAGWAVMVCLPAVHLDPTKYKNPLEFNPWRWEGVDTSVGSKTFMAFGGGMRLCIGADFTKVQMAVFLHCLVTKYKWKSIKGGDIVRSPGLKFPNGFH